MNYTQPPLTGMALRCGWNNCDKDAVCALRNRTNPSLIVNCCEEHYARVMGVQFTPDDIDKN